MPDRIGYDSEDFASYDEDYVDLDEHAHARAYAQRKRAEETRERARHDDFYDEYHYGTESGEVYGEKDQR